jgi:hypothetical protein
MGRGQTCPHLFSAVDARAAGARRLRRFRVAQTRDVTEKPRLRKSRTVKRPEGRAPTQIVVGTLTTYVVPTPLNQPSAKKVLFFCCQNFQRDVFYPWFPTIELPQRFKSLRGFVWFRESYLWSAVRGSEQLEKRLNCRGQRYA